MNRRKQWELDRLLRLELSRRFAEAGWIAAVGEGVDDLVFCAFRKKVSEGILGHGVLLVRERQRGIRGLSEVQRNGRDFLFSRVLPLAGSQ